MLDNTKKGLNKLLVDYQKNKIKEFEVKAKNQTSKSKSPLNILLDGVIPQRTEEENLAKNQSNKPKPIKLYKSKMT